MRKWFDKYLAQEAESDPSIRLLIADVGEFPLFTEKHPDKFINAGVSESNVIGVAGGLASEGCRVFVYGVSGFFLYRAYEQFKYSIAYWCKNVTFVGVGFGWKYYPIGTGHFTPDDIALMRLMPNMIIHTPYKLSQLQNLITNKKSIFPSYIRLTSNIVDEKFPSVLESNNYTLITYGEMAQTAINVVHHLRSLKHDIGYILIDSWKETDLDVLIMRHKSQSCFLIEDHYKIGGLKDILLDRECNIKYHAHLPINTSLISDSRKGLVQLYNLDEECITSNIISILNNE